MCEYHRPRCRQRSQQNTGAKSASDGVSRKRWRYKDSENTYSTVVRVVFGVGEAVMDAMFQRPPASCHGHITRHASELRQFKTQLAEPFVSILTTPLKAHEPDNCEEHFQREARLIALVRPLYSAADDVQCERTQSKGVFLQLQCVSSDKPDDDSLQ
jgi:hypothetical protein